MTHTRKDLSSIVDPWLQSLKLPLKLTCWEQDLAIRKNLAKEIDPKKIGTMIVRGQSHWYAITPRGETWILTVRADHVEVRDDSDEGPTVASWHTIQAADPEFFTKLEKDLRLAVAYLERN